MYVFRQRCPRPENGEAGERHREFLAALALSVHFALEGHHHECDVLLRDEDVRHPRIVIRREGVRGLPRKYLCEVLEHWHEFRISPNGPRRARDRNRCKGFPRPGVGCAGVQDCVDRWGRGIDLERFFAVHELDGAVVQASY